MISEADLIRDLTNRYLGHPRFYMAESLVSILDQHLDGRLNMTIENRFSLARTSRELMEREAPSAEVAERAAKLFDIAAAANWEPDTFGERYEVCAYLAFVSWRHSAAQGLENDSQEWLRNIERVVSEGSVAFECVTSFLYLPPDELTPDLAVRFLQKPEDIFFALSILKRDRQRRPRAVVAGATAVYDRVSQGAFDAMSEEERQFFLGEAALLVGGTARYVGTRQTVSRWLSVALSHFQRCRGGAPLIAKVRLCFAALAKDCHEHDESRRWMEGLYSQFVRWEMTREAFTCRLLENFILKDDGSDPAAVEGLSKLVIDLRGASEPSLLAAALAALGELLYESGDSDSARRLLHEALPLSINAGDSVIASCICLALGECETEGGRLTDSIQWFNAGMAAAESTASSSLVAYFRVWMADALIERSLEDDARALLMLAIPVLKDQEMIPETIHALKLLQQIDVRNSRRSDRPRRD